jgi:hypothetical protein
VVGLDEKIPDHGPRGAIYHRLTPLGRKILALLDWVESQGSVEPEELGRIFGEDAVNAAVNAGLLETRVDRVERVKIVKAHPRCPAGGG